MLVMLAEMLLGRFGLAIFVTFHFGEIVISLGMEYRKNV